jgi:hypothetical protein
MAARLLSAKEAAAYQVRMTNETKASQLEAFPTHRAIRASLMRKARRVPENGTEITPDFRDKMKTEWLVTRN